jgi:hypothetical protein
VYTKEFKAGAVALAGKREKPVRQIAGDLGSTKMYCTGGFNGQRRPFTTIYRHSPDTDGPGTRNWSVCGRKTRR